MSLLEIYSDQLREHADRVDGIASEIQTAIDAANSVSASENVDAYGILCAPFLVPIIATLEETAKVFIRGARETVEINADAARFLADLFETVDEHGAEIVERSYGPMMPPELIGGN